MSLVINFPSHRSHLLFADRHPLIQTLFLSTLMFIQDPLPPLSKYRSSNVPHRKRKNCHRLPLPFYLHCVNHVHTVGVIFIPLIFFLIKDQVTSSPGRLS